MQSLYPKNPQKTKNKLIKRKPEKWKKRGRLENPLSTGNQWFLRQHTDVPQAKSHYTEEFVFQETEKLILLLLWELILHNLKKNRAGGFLSWYLMIY